MSYVPPPNALPILRLYLIKLKKKVNMKHQKKVPVCIIDDRIQYGTEHEAKAAKLKPGDKITFEDVEDIVEEVWYYDGVIVNLKSGRAIYAALGDNFIVLQWDTLL